MVYESLLDLLLPTACLHCGEAAEADGLCPACRGLLTPNRPCCPRCAEPLPPEAPADRPCGKCLRHPPPFERLVAPWLYRPPLDSWIRDLKLSARLPVGRVLGRLLAGALELETPPELLVPVPRHPGALRRHGFNHAAEITRSLAAATGLPWRANLLTKVRATDPQATLDRARRLANLRGAFHFDNRQRWRRVAVVDDVSTTTSTARAVAAALRGAGVEVVEVWTVARTP